MACLAAFYGSYRLSFDRGYAAGQPKWPQQEVVSIAYDISDLLESDLNGQLDFDSWIDALTTSLEAASWHDTGGPGTIVADQTNKSIVVNQAPEVHEKIRGVLKSVRDGRSKTKAAEPK